MAITAQVWKKVEQHFGRPCELTENGEIMYHDGNFRVGYIGEGEFAGWLVDTTGDRDELVCRLAN